MSKKKKFFLIKGLCVVILFAVVMTIYSLEYIYQEMVQGHQGNYFISDIYLKQHRKYMEDNFDHVYLKQSQGIMLHAYRYVTNGSRYCLLVHGYNSEASSLMTIAKKMVENNYNVYVVDLRGNGLSEGANIGLGVLDGIDLHEWIEYIVEQDPHASIFLYGLSMGAATLLNMSQDDFPFQVKGMICDSSYTSLQELYNYHVEYPLLLPIFRFYVYVRGGFDFLKYQPIKQVAHATLPILFIHGKYDSIVPLNQVYELYLKAPQDKMLRVYECEHGNGYLCKGYYDDIEFFVKNYE